MIIVVVVVVIVFVMIVIIVSVFIIILLYFTNLRFLFSVNCLLYSRLTFPLTDPIQLNKMAAPEILAYDVIAVEPDNEKLLHKVCTESEHVDVITFNYLAGNAPAFKVQPGIVKVGGFLVLFSEADFIDSDTDDNDNSSLSTATLPLVTTTITTKTSSLSTATLPLVTTTKTVYFRQQVAQERGIHFEIAVGPGLRASANAKQNLISYGRRIVAATKGKDRWMERRIGDSCIWLKKMHIPPWLTGKNIILTNGAVKASEVRGPYDLMNLGVLFGMNQSQAKNAVTR